MASVATDRTGGTAANATAAGASPLAELPTPEPAKTQGARYHELDALRAFAMLLGIAFHVWAIANTLPETASGASDIAVRFFTGTSHAFRMPLFFIMAGFFAALVVARGGARPFVRGRTKRIGLPLLVGGLVMIPMLNVIGLWGRSVVSGESLAIGVGDLLEPNSHHLWFLWYLLLYYAVALAIRATVTRGPLTGRAFEFAAASPWRLALLVPLTAALIWPTPLWTSEVPTDFTPNAEPFFYYGLFFGFGWLLYAQRELLPELRRNTNAHTLVAIAAAIGVIVLSEFVPDGGTRRTLAHLAIVGTTALLTWTAIFALFGWFHRWFGRTNARVRWVADSAYWLYLAHLPLVAATYYGMTEVGVPLVVKLVVIPIGVTLLLLVAYERWIRHGAIGRVLHGPR
jgi:peptidoglycan/LPS O-acetylase OafA/YrhL